MNVNLKFEVKQNTRARKNNAELNKIIGSVKKSLEKAKSVNLEEGKAIYLLESKSEFDNLAKQCNLASSTFRVHLSKIEDGNLKVIASENSGTIKIVNK